MPKPPKDKAPKLPSPPKDPRTETQIQEDLLRAAADMAQAMDEVADQGCSPKIFSKCLGAIGSLLKKTARIFS